MSTVCGVYDQGTASFASFTLAHSRAWQATGQGQWAAVRQQADTLEVPENGYVVAYLSSSGTEDVYFDNLQAAVVPGVLLEERHYYPYGLPIVGLGTANPTGLARNRLRYQGNEYRQELGLDWMDFHNRQYDPKLGRFLSIDPLADAGGQQALSPYQAMGGNPVAMVDPLGLRSITTPAMSGQFAYQHFNPYGNFSPAVQYMMWRSSNYGDYLAQQNSALAKAVEDYVRFGDMSGLLATGSVGTLFSGSDASNLFSVLQTVYSGAPLSVDGYSFNKYDEYGNREWVSSEGFETIFYSSEHGQDLLLRLAMSLMETYNSGRSHVGQENGGNVNQTWVKTANELYGKSTFIPGTAMSFAATKPGKMLSVGGSYVWKASTYSAQRSLARELAIGSKFMKGAGNAIGYTGLFFTGADMIVNGVNTSNLLDAAMGIISFIPGGGWIAGGIYFIGNGALEATTGMNAGQWIDVGINKFRQ